MVTVQKEGIILEKTNREFKSHGMMNPATIEQGEDMHLYHLEVGNGHQSTVGYYWLIGSKLVAGHRHNVLMFPEEAFERNEIIASPLPNLNILPGRSQDTRSRSDVVFSTGNAQMGDTLYIYCCQRTHISGFDQFARFGGLASEPMVA